MSNVFAELEKKIVALENMCRTADNRAHRVETELQKVPVLVIRARKVEELEQRIRDLEAKEARRGLINANSSTFKWPPADFTVGEGMPISVINSVGLQCEVVSNTELDQLRRDAEQWRLLKADETLMICSVDDYNAKSAAAKNWLQVEQMPPGSELHRKKNGAFFSCISTYNDSSVCSGDYPRAKSALEWAKDNSGTVDTDGV